MRSRTVVPAIVILAIAIALPGATLVPSLHGDARGAEPGRWTLQIEGGVLATGRLVLGELTSSAVVSVTNETRLSTGFGALDAVLDWADLSSGYSLSVYVRPIGAVTAQPACGPPICEADHALLLPGRPLDFG